MRNKIDIVMGMMFTRLSMTLAVLVEVVSRT
jgi:hypothetical protein